MLKKVLGSFSLISFFLISCGAVDPPKAVIQKTERISDSSGVLNVKPLSTEKTHEGGVDKTQQIFKLD